MKHYTCLLHVCVWTQGVLPSQDTAGTAVPSRPRHLPGTSCTWEVRCGLMCCTRYPVGPQPLFRHVHARPVDLLPRGVVARGARTVRCNSWGPRAGVPLTVTTDGALVFADMLGSLGAHTGAVQAAHHALTQRLPTEVEEMVLYVRDFKQPALHPGAMGLKRNAEVPCTFALQRNETNDSLYGATSVRVRDEVSWCRHMAMRGRGGDTLPCSAVRTSRYCAGAMSWPWGRPTSPLAG